MPHRPPKNDRERLQNLIEALSEPGDGDDAFDEAMHAELARRGLTLETWAEQIREKAQAALERNRRARRVRALKLAAAVTAALVAAAGVSLAVQERREGSMRDASTPTSTAGKPKLPRSVPDAVDAPQPK